METIMKETDIPALGQEQAVCSCGRDLDTVNIYFKERVVYKVCPCCFQEYFLDVRF
jgi:hypothetical protein